MCNALFLCNVRNKHAYQQKGILRVNVKEEKVIYRNLISYPELERNK